MNNVEEQNDEIDLLDLCKLLWSKKVLIALVTIAGAIVGLLYSAIFIKPRYEASIDLIVNSRNDSSVGNISNDNITSAQKLAETYAVIIKENTVLLQVIEDLNLDMSYEKLSKMITVGSVNNTQVMSIVVNDTDPVRAEKIVNRLGKIAPPILVDAVQAGSCKVVSDVYSTGKPVSPNIMKNALIVALIMFIISCAVIIARDLLDNTFKSELDIQNATSLPVLGVLPSVESCTVELSSKRKKR